MVERQVPGRPMLYALSTCAWCKKTRKLLQDLGVKYDCIEVDLLQGNAKAEALKSVERCNPQRSFPTLLINGTCIVGFKENEIRKALGL